MPAISVTTPSALYQVDITRGILRTLEPRIRRLAGKPTSRVFVVTSPNIWELWSKAFLASYPRDKRPEVLFVPQGERYKRLAAVERLAEELAQAGADRDSLLLAFGGGVIGDITGFLAAIYMRGVPYVQIPTTLLAQVDSSVGGKTGVNLRAGKNLIGSFHHPLATLVDPELLRTLPANELRSGLQEAIKSGIIADPALVRLLEANVLALLPRGSRSKTDLEVLTRVVIRSVRVKAAIVNQDERENGLRMALNLGHTIGHAIESATKYKALLHGEAVGWGMIAALYVAHGRGTISARQFERLTALIQAYGPLPSFRATAGKLVALTASDKKRRSGQRAFVLPTGIGSVEIVRDVTDAELIAATQAMLDRMRAGAVRNRA